MIADLIFSHVSSINIIAVLWSAGFFLIGYGVAQRDEAKRRLEREREERRRAFRGPWK